MPERPDTPDPESIDLDDIRVVLSLDRLGELIAYVAKQLTEQRGLEPPDFEGEEMRSIAIGGWKYVMHMADREVFKASIASDLAALEANPFPPLPRIDRSEFGL